jgi:phage baseplate assembly protein W
VTKKQAETWILSSDNKNFSKLWNDKEVPEKIQDMYRDTFGSDIAELIDEYVADITEFTQRIEERKKKYLRKWLSQTTRETEKSSENIEITHLKQLEEEEKLQAQKEHSIKYVGRKTLKERQKEEEEMAKIGPKESKKMERIRNIHG